MNESKVQKVTIESSDGQKFKLNEEDANKAITIKNMIADADGNYTFVNFPGKTLKLIVDYLEGTDLNYDELKVDDLFELTKAANYLDIESLLNLLCIKSAGRIANKSPASVRKFFGIEDDSFKEVYIQQFEIDLIGEITNDLSVKDMEDITKKVNEENERVSEEDVRKMINDMNAWCIPGQ